jgi:hypothetical protein
MRLRRAARAGARGSTARTARASVGFAARTAARRWEGLLALPLAGFAHDGLTELARVVCAIATLHAFVRARLAVCRRDISRALCRAARAACASSGAARATQCGRFTRARPTYRLCHLSTRPNIHDTAIIIAARRETPSHD